MWHPSRERINRAHALPPPEVVDVDSQDDIQDNTQDAIQDNNQDAIQDDTRMAQTRTTPEPQIDIRLRAQGRRTTMKTSPLSQLDGPSP